MTIKAPYRVSQPSATQGTGAYSLGSAIGANQAFSAVYANGALVPVFVTDGTNDYEVGAYTLNSGVTPNTLTRTTVLLSSNSNAAVNWGPGTRNIGAWEAASAKYALTTATNYTADVGDWGNAIIHTANGGHTFTLPALTAVPLGYSVEVTHTGTSTLTTAVNGADAILGGLTAPVLSQGQRVQFVKHTSGWLVFGTTSNNDLAASTLTVSGQITSTLATGTAPLVVASTTAVANLNASLLLGSTWASPAAIGTGTPAAITGTTVTANTSVTTPTMTTASGPLTLTSATTEVLLSGGASSSSFATSKVWIGSDITFSGADHMLAANAYFASGWKYVGNGSAAGLVLGVTSSVAAQLFYAANNVGGAGVALTNSTALAVSTAGNVSIGADAGAESLRVVPVASADEWLVSAGSNGGNASLKANARNLLLGSGSALATDATAGMICIPACAGAPSGAPTGAGLGAVALVYDTTDEKLYRHNGTNWKSVTFA